MIRNDRSVDVFVHKLRRKLRDASPGWSYIRTHHGMGYSRRRSSRRTAPRSQLVGGAASVSLAPEGSPIRKS